MQKPKPDKYLVKVRQLSWPFISALNRLHCRTFSGRLWWHVLLWASVLVALMTWVLLMHYYGSIQG